MLVSTKSFLATIVLIVHVENTIEQVNSEGKPQSPFNRTSERESVKEDRIIDGEPAVEGEFPYMVSLMETKRRVHQCGGGLLTSEYVLTACHCIVVKQNYDLTLVLQPPGYTTINAGTIDATWNQGVKRLVVDVKAHPNCNRFNTWVWDIAIVKAERPYHLQKGFVEVMPFTMFNKTPGFIQDMIDQELPCTGMGFGSTVPKAAKKPLMKVQLHLVQDDKCYDYIIAEYQKQDDLGRFAHAIQTCTLGQKPGGDACQGDSGSPLVCVSKKGPMLTGVASWGIGCGRHNVPGVWARFDAADYWVHEVINSASFNIGSSLLISIGTSTVINKMIQ